MRRRHPWVLSGAVARVAGDAQPGDWVRVVSAEGEILAHGHVSPHSQLRVRLVAFGKEPPPEGWLAARVAEAVARRAADPLLAGTDAVRLVNAEGDGLPGLVVDRYRDLVVVKLTSAGMAARSRSRSPTSESARKSAAAMKLAPSAIGHGTPSPPAATGPATTSAK